MSPKARLVGMQAALDQIAHDSAKYGYVLVWTLSAAAAEAVRDELAALDCARAKAGDARRQATGRLEHTDGGPFAMAAAPSERSR
jgi:hypothetical protein